ncbi:hypothetical protein K7X08_011497 [Anisodus acutangulus]|uniref:F-box protein n=1 Tax=Anisodus acutangulus TaxID=402998 RepID=A0A9Q1RLX6_9SOLA|nr:hypothetical protein K7X08_011497 [Anisodus acutangulus]
MEGDIAVGFICEVDNPNKDVILFTIVRYEIPRRWDELQLMVTIESFSSETNVWTANSIIFDAPLRLCPLNWDITSAASSAGVINGVFCWLDQVGRQITVYDSVYKCFWALEFPEETVSGCRCYLGLSVWVWKYDVDVAATVLQCPEEFGLGGNTLRVKAFGITGSLRTEVQNMVIHPVFPHIFYLDVRGKVISYDLETDIAEFVSNEALGRSLKPQMRIGHYNQLNEIIMFEEKQCNKLKQKLKSNIKPTSRRSSHYLKAE